MFNPQSSRLRVAGNPNWKPLIAASTVLGLGMGGFFDGILFHQILQLHNMLSHKLFPDTPVNIEINMFWDGIFHAFTWTTTSLGLGLFWRAIRKPEVPLSTLAFVSSLFLGWGIFNFVEGIIDHLILELHHVVERSSGSEQFMYDMLFLASGLIFIAGGWLGIRRAKNDLAASQDEDRAIASRVATVAGVPLEASRASDASKNRDQKHNP